MKKLGTFKVSLSIVGVSGASGSLEMDFLRGRVTSRGFRGYHVGVTWVADFPGPGSRLSCAGASDPADTDNHSRTYSNSSRTRPLFHNLRTIVSFSFRLKYNFIIHKISENLRIAASFSFSSFFRRSSRAFFFSFSTDCLISATVNS